MRGQAGHEFEMGWKDVSDEFWALEAVHAGLGAAETAAATMAGEQAKMKKTN